MGVYTKFGIGRVISQKKAPGIFLITCDLTPEYQGRMRTTHLIFGEEKAQKRYAELIDEIRSLDEVKVKPTKLYRYLLQEIDTDFLAQTLWISTDPSDLCEKEVVRADKAFLPLGKKGPFKVVSWETKDLKTTEV